MQLADLIHRTPTPLPWEEGDNIPWNEPGFSKRMLREHLTQEHDAASRRFDKIDRHVQWIHENVLGKQPNHILDLGCGPGLYTQRLARFGHTCAGIDYSPASIAYAMQAADREGLPCTYQCQDIRQADYGTGYGLAMQIFGEINVFRPDQARHILSKAWQALQPGGRLLIEPHSFTAIERIGKKFSSWYTSSGGLFSPVPHLVLEESFWEGETHVATNRFFVVDAATGEVTRYAQSLQAYTDDEYRQLVEECGFTEITFYPNLGEVHIDHLSELIAIVARKE